MCQNSFLALKRVLCIWRFHKIFWQWWINCCQKFPNQNKIIPAGLNNTTTNCIWYSSSAVLSKQACTSTCKKIDCAISYTPHQKCTNFTTSYQQSLNYCWMSMQNRITIRHETSSLFNNTKRFQICDGPYSFLCNVISAEGTTMKMVGLCTPSVLSPRLAHRWDRYFGLPTCLY